MTTLRLKSMWLMILCVFLLAAFAVWLVKSGIEQKSKNAYLREVCTEATTGVVTRYNMSGNYHVDAEGEQHDSRRAFPVFGYTLGDRDYSLQSERYDSRGELRYEVGQEIAVFYAPDDPEKIYIPTEDSTENAWMCIGFGSALLAFCAFALIRFFYFM